MYFFICRRKFYEFLCIFIMAIVVLPDLQSIVQER